jgi:hypothetical protein
MGKRAVSLTLSEDNVLWLKGQATSHHGNLSAAVDRLISEVRAGRMGASRTARSVVGTIDLPSDDPELDAADAAIRNVFAASLAKPSIAAESSPEYGTAPKTRKAKKRCG